MAPSSKNFYTPHCPKEETSPPRPMASSSNNLGTPRCPAEQRAWLLVFQNRLGTTKRLSEAFKKQFPNREHSQVIRHANSVRDCKSETQSQLLELAKQCPWYVDKPQEGERGYKQVKRAENQNAARVRRARQKKEFRDFEAQKRRDFEEMQGSEEQDTRSGIDNDEILPRTGGHPQEAEAAKTSLAGESAAFSERVLEARQRLGRIQG